MLSWTLAYPFLGVLPGLAASGATEPLHILVIGDSQAQGLAAGLQWVFRQDRGCRIIDRSRISTGLTQRSSLDWPAAVHDLVETEHADVAVVMFGANDRPPVRVGGHIDPGLAAAFRRSYGAKVREILETLTAARIPVIWVGHPIVRDPDYAEDMALLNQIFADAALAAGADFVPLWDTFADANHAFTAYGPALDGQTTRLRADDGVHLTPAGYCVAAKLLQPLIYGKIRPLPAASPAEPSDPAPPAPPATSPI